ncbi:MAG TPA: hypothetical protein ENN74_01390 [Firmicutes bacterium]|nr:hypothetical protein [Bacillota bacterium]
MDSLTKYYLGWGLAGLAILAFAGYLVYSYQGSLKPAPPDEPVEPVIPRGVPRTGDASSKGVLPVEDSNGLSADRSQLKWFLPQADDDGVPFTLTDASEHANRAFKLMREKKFNEALGEYRMAYDLDPRYEMVLKRTEDLIQEIRRSGFDVAKNRRVYPGTRLTYKQLYDWD